jgi:hypothetical protein
MELSLVPLGIQESFSEVSGAAPFKLAADLAAATRWLFSLKHAGPVREVRLFGRLYRLDKNGRVEITQEEDRASLLGNRIMGERPFMLAAGRVRASGAVTVRFFEGGQVIDITAQPDRQFIPPRRRAALQEIDVIVPDGVEFYSLALSTSPATLGR